MEKFSVKKPFTILVMVVVIVALGFVSLPKMSTDLLPSFNMPYLLVITPYPGASPEKVEAEVTEPLEGALGTVNGVKTVYSINNENYSVVELEFETDVNMDSTLVKVSSALDQIGPTLPDSAMSPTLLEISMDMVATLYLAVNHDDYDIYELSDYINDEIIPYLERQTGVARASTVGLVERSVQVDLDRQKIDELNDRILAETNKALAEAKDMLDEAQTAADAAQAELDRQKEAFGPTVSESIFDQLGDSLQGGAVDLQNRVIDLINSLNDLQYAVEMADYNAKVAQAQAEQAAAQAQAQAEQAAAQAQAQAEQAAAQAQAQAEQAAAQAQQELEAAQARAEQAAEEARKAASDFSDADIAQLRSQIDQLLQTANNINGSSAADLSNSSAAIAAQLAGIAQTLNTLAAQDTTGEITAEIANARAALQQVSAGISNLPSILSQAEDAYAELTQAQLEAAIAFTTAQAQLSEAQNQLAQARSQYNDYREEALQNADVDSLLSAATLSQLIYAQNFSMPAGYIDDAEDNSWLLKIGDAFEEPEELEHTLLVDVEPIGPVRLSDVAQVSVIDNAGDSYARLNGNDGVIVCVYKSSTAGTNEVSRGCAKALAELQNEDAGLQVVSLVDQGSYITMIIRNILSSMLLGAALAILILALFLRSVRPTILVAISIPLSVLTTLVLMYFSKLSLNMMTLSGIALGIGMLVDNSIVVMENIFRLRTMGIPAARAAVQGAKQMRGAIVASTLTTVCVFVPMVFTTGTVRELLIPMALSIGYCLMASLLIALTVVPAAASTILANYQPKESNRFFRRVQEGYGKLLSWCLEHKPVPILISIALLALTAWQTLRTGVVLLPEMTADNLQVSISVSPELNREEAYRKVDEVMDALLNVEDVENVGIMDEESSTALVTSFASAGGFSGNFICYVTSEKATNPKIFHRIVSDIEEASSAIADVAVTVAGGGLSDIESFFGSSDLTVNVYGDDTDKLKEYGAGVRAIIEEVPGFTDVSDGAVEGDRTLHLTIDKDKVASFGLTIAQVYMQISERITTSVTSTTLTADGTTMDVIIRDETDPLTKENLLEMEFTGTSYADAAGGMEFGDGTDLAEAFSAFEEEFGEEASANAADVQTQETDENTVTDPAAENPAGDDGIATEEASGNETDGKNALTHKLGEFATVEETTSLGVINRENQTRYLVVTANTEDGYNTTLLTRTLEPKLAAYAEGLPEGYRVSIAGQTEEINTMLSQMIRMILLALLFIYLVMVAQFQSLLSPFIVFFTVPLAFTGGMLGLMIAREHLSMLAMMGFLILMGTVVNNGIVFVDYANQLRSGGLERRDALIATGRTRMRPILMTTLTTVLAMGQLIFGSGMGSQLGRGMAIVISGGLLYATLMTLFLIPVMYDIFFKRKPLQVDVGDDIDDVPDDAAQFLEEFAKK